MRRPTIAAVGDNTIDRYHDGTVFVGGNALNVAVQLRQLGLACTYFGAIGEDGDGRRIADALWDRGVDTAGLVISAGLTAVTDIRITPDGDRVFEREEFGVTATYEPSDAEVARIADHDWVHIGMLAHAETLVRRLRTVNPQVGISQDCAVSSGFALLDVAFCSAKEDLGAGRSAAEKALAGGAALAVVTQGAAGARAYSGGESWRCDAMPTDLVDTTGAGDSFIAGFIAARLAGADMPAALEAGARLAARTCAHRGGFLQ